jgi:hypothetical protein
MGIPETSKPHGCRLSETWGLRSSATYSASACVQHPLTPPRVSMTRGDGLTYAFVVAVYAR